MSTAATWVRELSPTLYWDTDPLQVDPALHLKSIVERVLERGHWADWQLLTSHVSSNELKELLPRLRVPPRELAFLEAYLGTTGAP